MTARHGTGLRTGGSVVGDSLPLLTADDPLAAHSRRWAGTLLGALDRVIGTLATLCLAALIAIILANVIGRYVFNSSLTWAAESAQWLFIYIIFLAIPLAHRARMHLSITFLVDRLPERPRAALGFGSETIVAYTTILVLFGAQDLIAAIGGTNHVLGLPAWVKFALIPASCGAGLVYIGLRGFDRGEAVWRGPAAIVLAAVLYLVVNQFDLISLRGANPAVTMALAFLIAMALGTPVSFAMLFSTFMANLASGLLPEPAVVQNVVNGAGKFLLLAIPFFITAGALMNVGGLTQRLMDFAFKLVGHFRGGFAQVNVVSSMLYGGISGSSYSEAALGTKLLVPQMVRHGYTPAFSCAITAASAVLPNIIPPSIALLILAAAANLSVGELWLAGVGPGAAIVVCLMVSVYLIARVRGIGTATERAPGPEKAKAFLHALPVLVLAVVILGGIRFGIVTPTEAGVLAVVYAALLGMVGYRAYGPRGLWQTLQTCAVEAALIGLLIGVAAPFAFVLVAEQVPQTITAYVTGLSDNPYIVLLIANGLMLFFGMFLDIGAAILILTPLLMPLMISLGVDPIHFGLVIVVNLMMGGLTPPVGMLVFLTGTISRTPVHQIFRAIYPFFAALIVALLFVTYVPALALGLGWLIGGK
ncbi:MAG: TRAP transporter large permease subunit [Alphaproteobacteria bacterium]|nr:TRAP transporter large permease subunit [Alphaproteobacteria bacterium]